MYLLGQVLGVYLHDSPLTSTVQVTKLLLG